MIFLAHETEQNVIDAEAQISANCHFPNDRGTDKWANVFYSDQHEVFYILKPPVEGWTDGVESFTQEQMMANVVNVIEIDI
jgi:hypothetical protein